MAFTPTKHPKLKALIPPSEVLELRGNPDVAITGIAYHSGEVKPGFLFAAIKGEKADGHGYITEAVRRGAAAVLYEHGRPDGSGCVLVRAADSRASLARASAEFYGHPSRELTVIGVTGTNGKTTTSFLLESILKAAGYEVGVIGTINYRYQNTTLKAATTTPQSSDLQRLLREMRQAGVSHVIMEVSSHALNQKRVEHVDFRGAVFTNLSHDHLDYHIDMERYFLVKSRLFDVMASGGNKDHIILVNGDDPYGVRLAGQCGDKCVLYGLENGVQLRATDVQTTFGGLKASISDGRRRFEVNSHLMGFVNIYNVLAAVGVGLGLGLDIPVLEKGVNEMELVPGRLFPVKGKNRAVALIDYAHTPDALNWALESVKHMSKGRIITVFGCGGDRDRSKRPLMGQVAGEHSNLVVVTSDNPRNEEPLDVIRDIEPGVQRAGLKHLKWSQARHERGYLVIPDRKEAIRAAVRLSGPGDVILIAGKGHESYQIVGDMVRDFDDSVEARKALEEYD